MVPPGTRCSQPLQQVRRHFLPEAVAPCGSRIRVIFRAPSLALGSRLAGLRTSKPSGSLFVNNQSRPIDFHMASREEGIFYRREIAKK